LAKACPNKISIAKNEVITDDHCSAIY